MAIYPIRVFPDPVLRAEAAAVTDFGPELARLADDMFETMYEAPGVGLAAPQIGIAKQIFVADIGEGPFVMVNPEIVETSGKWKFEEGCLSVPGLFWDIVRPKEIHLIGYDLDGNEVSIEADEILARLFQHELDHLDGVLLVDRLDADTRKVAMRNVRKLFLSGDGEPAHDKERAAKSSGGLSLP